MREPTGDVPALPTALECLFLFVSVSRVLFCSVLFCSVLFCSRVLTLCIYNVRFFPASTSLHTLHAAYLFPILATGITFPAMHSRQKGFEIAIVGNVCRTRRWHVTTCFRACLCDPDDRRR